jgi:hypothetical protein
LLSSYAGLALILSQQFDFFKPKILQDAFLVWLFLIFPLSTYNFQSPTSILYNLIFAPAFGLILFPLGLCAYIFPLLFPVYDLIVEFFLKILSALEIKQTTNELYGFPQKNSIYLLWLIWIAFFAILYQIQIIKIRKRNQ